MKITQNQVVNSKILETKDIVKTEKTNEAQKVSSNSTNRESATIFARNNTYRSTFTLQEFISQMQMKISSVSLFQQNQDFETINQATYNNIPLFTKSEKEEIFRSRNDLSSIIKDYQSQIDNLTINVNNILRENSNSIVSISEKQVKDITGSIYKMLPNTIKENSTSAILDLLK
ncbi:MAG: hypothetical protein ACK4YF_00520 [Exilispira sp.]